MFSFFKIKSIKETLVFALKSVFKVFFKLIFFMIDHFNILILKINLKNKKIILPVYLNIKNIKNYLKNNYERERR